VADNLEGVVGSISDGDGEIFVVRADGARAEPGPDSPVSPGDTIITGEDGSATLTLADGTVIEIDAGTSVTVEQVVLADGSAQIVLNVSEGAVLVIAGSTSDVTIATPSATAVLEGGTLAVLARPEGEDSAFTLFENDDGSLGLAEITNDAGSALLTRPYHTVALSAADQAPLPTILSGSELADLYDDALGILGDRLIATAAGSDVPANGPTTPDLVGFEIGGLDGGHGGLFSTLFESGGDTRFSSGGLSGSSDPLPARGASGGDAAPGEPGLRAFVSEDEITRGAELPQGESGVVFFADLDQAFYGVVSNPFTDSPTQAGDFTFGDDGDNVFFMLAGDDLAFGGGGNDQIFGGLGQDFLFGEAGNDTLNGGVGPDYLHGGTGNDVLLGTLGADSYVWHDGGGLDQISEEVGDILIPLPGPEVPGVFALGEEDDGPVPSGGEEEGDTVDRLGIAREFAFGGLYGSVDVVQGVIDSDLIGRSVAYDGRGAMYLPTDMNAYRDAGDLVLDSLTSAGEGVRITGHFADPSLALEEIHFDDFVFATTIAPAAITDDAGVTAIGQLGSDFMVGGDGNDELIGDGLDDSGTDVLHGNGGADLLSGGGGRDFLIGGDGADSLFGGSGDDYLVGGDGVDVIDGGEGLDWVDAHGATAGVTLDLTLGTMTDAYGNIDSVVGVENFRGSQFGDDVIGDDAVNEFQGFDGNDRLRGMGGTDFLWGFAGNDTLEGGNGNDALIGGDGDDNLLGGLGIDFLLGERGNDALAGNEGNDRLFGGGGEDTLSGGDGDDLLLGGRGADSVFGGAGDDTIAAGNGDVIDGGEGLDTVALETYVPTIVDLEDGTVSGAGFMVSLSGIEVLVGGALDDRIFGSAEGDVLRGGAGNDSIDGRGGDDVLLGGGGYDTLIGGDGRDVLNGGSLGDRLEGGAGNDFYVVGATESRAAGANGEFLRLSATFGTLAESALDSRPDDFSTTDDLDIISDSSGDADAIGFAIRNWANAFDEEADVVSPATLSAYADGDDLVIRDLTAPNTGIEVGVRIEGHFGSGSQTVEWVVFESQPGLEMRVGQAGSNESDFVVGSDLGDLIDGGDGSDALYGNGGDDTLIGGAGDDVLRGDAGADRFVFTSILDGNDVIADFDFAEGDVVDFDALFDSLGIAEGDRAGALDISDSAAGITVAVTTADASFSVTFSDLDTFSLANVDQVVL
jgi:Ca2+-binding RTX toxin-like protein